MPLALLGFWNGVKKVPGWVWFALVAVAAALLAIYITDRNAVVRTKRKEEIKDLKDTIVLKDAAHEIVEAVEERVEGAEEAVARLPWLRSTRELWKHNPELAPLIVTDPDGDDGSGGAGDLRRDAPAPDAGVAAGGRRPH